MTFISVHECSPQIYFPFKRKLEYLCLDNNNRLYIGARGYRFEGPEDLAVFRQPGALRTGDIATRDEDGYYYITGRMKRFVKLYGTRINLDEVELFLKNAFPGKTFLCLDGGDQYLVICHTGSEPEERSIRQLIAAKLRLPPGIIKINTLETIPLTPNGKTDYRAVKGGGACP